MYVTLTVDGHDLRMELDTGAAVSVLGEATYKAVWNVENSTITAAFADTLAR